MALVRGREFKVSGGGGGGTIVSSPKLVETDVQEGWFFGSGDFSRRTGDHSNADVEF